MSGQESSAASASGPPLQKRPSRIRSVIRIVIGVVVALHLLPWAVVGVLVVIASFGGCTVRIDVVDALAIKVGQEFLEVEVTTSRSVRDLEGTHNYVAEVMFRYRVVGMEMEVEEGREFDRESDTYRLPFLAERIGEEERTAIGFKNRWRLPMTREDSSIWPCHFRYDLRQKPSQRLGFMLYGARFPGYNVTSQEIIVEVPQ